MIQLNICYDYILQILKPLNVLLELQTVTRLNKLQTCMSAEATLQKVDECARGHDEKVRQWIASQVEYLNG